MKNYEDFNLSCNPSINDGISCTISTNTLKKPRVKIGGGKKMTIEELHDIVVKGFARIDDFITQQKAFNSQQTEFNKLVANFIQEQLAHNKMMEKRVGNLENEVREIKERVKKLDNRVAKLETTVDKLDNRVAKLETTVEKLDNRVAKLETKVETIEDQVKNIKAILKKNNIK
ncbi:BLOC-1 subunit 2 family protein [Mycoplasmopsis agassizii]|uniref:Uncharacterized protein n=1 Tax=Mycoplasmopsis agassizii TaxID=33922 RepID=A0ABX4H4H8_9BACT|nr:BLOC-1 subunit 2 family protein [Mycoplasmopsis agassizii]PAF54773.1 hypothetical protein CJF60_03485 [Mycoplasmopsis agassizii]